MEGAGLLETLHYNKGHQGSNPGGHYFFFLNVSINKKPFFFSEVVIYETVIAVIKSVTTLACDILLFPIQYILISLTSSKV
jgi:hypothetical protein